MYDAVLPWTQLCVLQLWSIIQWCTNMWAQQSHPPTSLQQRLYTKGRVHLPTHLGKKQKLITIIELWDPESKTKSQRNLNGIPALQARSHNWWFAFNWFLIFQVSKPFQQFPYIPLFFNFFFWVWIIFFFFLMFLQVPSNTFLNLHVYLFNDRACAPVVDDKNCAIITNHLSRWKP